MAKIKEKLWYKFTVIPIPVKDITHNYKLQPNVILYHILRLIGVQLKEKNKKLFEDNIDPLIKRFQGWQTKKASIDTEAKKATPGMIERILKFEESFKGKLETESKLFEKPTPNEIINGINIAARAFEKRRYFILPRRPVLILFYNLDKLQLESAREIFFTTFLSLIRIECNAVFTFPLVLKFDKEFIKMFRNFSQVYFLENFRIYKKNGEPNFNERYKLAEVVLKRVHRNISYKNTLEKIIQLSGGGLFEFIQLFRECCVIALREKINYIDNNILKEAEKRIRSNYKIVLSEEDIENLSIITISKSISEIANHTKLLNQFCITVYGSGDNIWYDVNQILLPRLVEIELQEE